MSWRITTRWVWSLCLLALLALGVIVLARQAPPFREVSDGAVLEIYTLEALKGSLLVGPYSRFGWHHPGPLYFYFEAPWYWLSGRHTLGMQVGALLINLAAFAAILWTVAKYGSSSTVAAIAIALTVFVYRTGDLIVSVWNPHVVILPLLAFIVTAAALAAAGGRARLLSLVLVGSFLVQTHVAMGPIVLLLATLAAGVQRRALRQAWLPAVCLALVLWLPSLVEQVTHAPGNITRLASFFVAPSSPGQSMATAVAAWSASLTGAFGRSFRVAMGFDFHAEETGRPLFWAIAQVTALGVAAVMARRRAGDFGAWIAAMCTLATLIALVSTTQIRDQIIDHEIFWMSALGVLNAGVIGGELWCLRPAPRAIAAVVCSAALVAAIGAGVTGVWHILHRGRTTDDHSVDVLTEAIQRMLQDGRARRPLFHIDEAVWPIAAGALLQLHKAGVAYAVDDRWTPMFGEAFEANGREDARLTITGSARLPRLVSAR
jgi:hypothetical protein